MAKRAMPVLDIEDGKLVEVDLDLQVNEVDVEAAVAAQKELLKKADRAEADAKKKIERAKAERLKAVEELNKFLEPVREELKGLNAERKAADTKVKNYVQKTKDAKAALLEVDNKIEELYSRLEEAGIPRVLLGVKRGKRGKQVNAPVVNGRTTIKPDMLGEFEPITITASKRHGNRDKESSVEIYGDGKQFYSRLVEYRNGDKINLKEELSSHRLSDVTTQPGWIETKDAAYGILYHLGRLADFPALRPVSDAATIKVNGEVIKHADYRFEVVEEVE